MSKIRKQSEAGNPGVMAVKLSKGRSDLTILAKELEIRPALLYRWRRELETKVETSFPGKGKVLYTPEQAVLSTILVVDIFTKSNKAHLYQPINVHQGKVNMNLS